MPITGTTPVPAKIAPTSDLDTYATHDEKYGIGGYRVVASISERNGITPERRKEGMRVYVTANSTEYILSSGLLNSDWSVVKDASIIIPTWSALTALDVSSIKNGTEFFVQGKSTPNDGREGFYWYDQTSTIPAIPGLVQIPNSGPGRFLKRYGNQIDPFRDMGADNTGTFDSGAILQAAIDFAAEPTFGWAKDSGSESRLGLGVTLLGSFVTQQPLILHGAVDFHGEKVGARVFDNSQYAQIKNKHGGHCLVIDMNNDTPHYRSASIRNINFVGYVETYQQNKKSITSVTDRLTFQVVSADAPAGLDYTDLYPANNTCFFYDDQNNYLGCGRMVSITPAGANTTIVLAAGSDSYSSINGTPGGKLTTACKIVFPPKISEESIAGINDFYDPAAAGSCAIYVKNTHPTALGAMPIIENISVRQFHCGIRIGPRIVGGSYIADLHFMFQKFASIACPRSINVTDLFFNGELYCHGGTRVDYESPVRSNVIDNPVMNYGSYGLFNVPAVCKFDRVLCEEFAYANIYFSRTIFAQFNHIFCDGVLRHGILIGPGYAVYSAPTTAFLSNSIVIGDFIVKNQLDAFGYDTVHSDLIGIKVEQWTALERPTFIHCGTVRAIRSSTSAWPIFTAFADLGSTSNKSRFTFGRFLERNGCAALYATGTKPIEQLPVDFTSASEVNTGWYDDGSKRAYCVAASDILSLASTGVTFGGNSFVGTPVKTVTSLGNAITFQRVGVSPQVFSIAFSTNAIRWHDDDLNLDNFSSFANASFNQFWIGSFLGNPSTARSSNLYSEGRSGGADLSPSVLNIIGPQGTGNATGGGDIQFYTADPGVSGSTVQSVSLKLSLRKTGQLRFPSMSPSGLGEGDVWFHVTKGFRQYFGAAERALGINRTGTVTLVAGVSTVTGIGSFITATTVILLTSQVDGGTPGFLRITAKVPGVSFTITSSSATDTSTVAWSIIEP